MAPTTSNSATPAATTAAAKKGPTKKKAAAAVAKKAAGKNKSSAPHHRHPSKGPAKTVTKKVAGKTVAKTAATAAAADLPGERDATVFDQVMAQLDASGGEFAFPSTLDITHGGHTYRLIVRQKTVVGYLNRAGEEVLLQPSSDDNDNEYYRIMPFA